MIDQSSRRSASRRSFLGGGAAAIAAAALGPSLLSACSSDNKTPAGTASTVVPDDGTPAAGLLRVSNWPNYMPAGFVDAFQHATGLQVQYREDFNDNEVWFSKYKADLAAHRDIGADLVVPTEFMALRLMDLGWLNQINRERVPNLANLRADLINSPADPGRTHIAPYLTGMVGLAYNKAATKRPITSVSDLWDPAFRGRVTMLADMQDGVGMVMQSQGNSPANPSTATVQQAVDAIRAQKDNGQIRRFTGNDYLDDLASGNVVVAQAYSGDIAGLGGDNPNLEFIIPDTGGMWYTDTMVIPYTTANQKAAEVWINYIYDRDNYAKIIEMNPSVPVLSDMTGALDKVDPKLSANPLINPSQQVRDRLVSWAALTDEQTQEYNTAYAAVTGG